METNVNTNHKDNNKKDNQKEVTKRAAQVAGAAVAGSGIAFAAAGIIGSQNDEMTTEEVVDETAQAAPQGSSATHTSTSSDTNAATASTPSPTPSKPQSQSTDSVVEETEVVLAAEETTAPGAETSIADENVTNGQEAVAEGEEEIEVPAGEAEEVLTGGEVEDQETESEEILIDTEGEEETPVYLTQEEIDDVRIDENELIDIDGVNLNNVHVDDIAAAFINTDDDFVPVDDTFTVNDEFYAQEGENADGELEIAASETQEELPAGDDNELVAQSQDEDVEIAAGTGDPVVGEDILVADNTGADDINDIFGNDDPTAFVDPASLA